MTDQVCTQCTPWRETQSFVLLGLVVGTAAVAVRLWGRVLWDKFILPNVAALKIIFATYQVPGGGRRGGGGTREQNGVAADIEAATGA